MVAGCTPSAAATGPTGVVAPIRITPSAPAKEEALLPRCVRQQGLSILVPGSTLVVPGAGGAGFVFEPRERQGAVQRAVVSPNGGGQVTPEPKAESGDDLSRVCSACGLFARLLCGATQQMLLLPVRSGSDVARRNEAKRSAEIKRSSSAASLCVVVDLDVPLSLIGEYPGLVATSHPRGYVVNAAIGVCLRCCQPLIGPKGRSPVLASAAGLFRSGMASRLAGKPRPGTS